MMLFPDTTGEIKHGGVLLSADQVHSYYTLKDSDGQDRYIVIFDNGVKAAYRGKTSGSETSILTSLSLGGGKDYSIATSTNATGIDGLEIIGTDGRDSFSVKDSTIISIDGKEQSNDNYGDILSLKGNTTRAKYTPSGSILSRDYKPSDTGRILNVESLEADKSVNVDDFMFPEGKPTIDYDT